MRRRVADVNIVGAGLEDLLAAVNATVALDPVSLSFGGVPTGSGQTRRQSLTLSNLGSTTKTLDLSIGTPAAGVGYSVSPASVTLAAGASVSVTITMTAKVGATGPQQASLEIGESGKNIAHAVLFTLLK